MPGILLSLGSINVDFQVRVERRPGPGEALPGRDLLMTSGGKGANRAVLARRLGAAAQLIARVGEDGFLAELALRPLRDAGVSLEATRVAKGVPTAVALIMVEPDGSKTIVLAGNANDAWEAGAAEQVAEVVREAPAGSVLAADLEISGDVVRRAVLAAHEAGHRVVLDPSPTDRLGEDLYERVDYLTPDAGEAERLTGIAVRSAEDGFRAAEALRSGGVGTAVVKLPQGGCVLVGKQTRLQVRPLPAEVIDKTGAGDAFAGALSVALLEGRGEREAAEYAVAAASYAVTRYGSQQAYPDREELERFMRSMSASGRS